MNKQTIRQAWEKVRRPLAFFCSGMIVMILAVFGMFWYYTGRATAMFEFSVPWKSSKAIMRKTSTAVLSLTGP